MLGARPSHRANFSHFERGACAGLSFLPFLGEMRAMPARGACTPVPKETPVPGPSARAPRSGNDRLTLASRSERLVSVEARGLLKRFAASALEGSSERGHWPSRESVGEGLP